MREGWAFFRAAVLCPAMRGFLFLRNYSDMAAMTVPRKIKWQRSNQMNKNRPTSRSRIIQLCITGMLCALAFVAVAVGRVPLIPSMSFLTFDPKDSIIVIGGLAFGPVAAAAISVIVALVEMLTISTTGPIGFAMNIISSCSFAVTASLIYKRKHSYKGALAALGIGWCAMIVAMIFWNWIVTPLYMHVSRDAVAGMLLPAIIPFNFIKGGINCAIALIIYKPVTAAFRRVGAFPEKQSSDGSVIRFSPKALLVALPILAVCIALIFALR